MTNNNSDGAQKGLNPTIVVMVPAYNEEEHISEVVREARRFAGKVLVCDDGSTDSTYRQAVDSGADVIRHRHNIGYGGALRTLFLRASSIQADVFVTIDSDGQHDSKFIPALTEHILKREADLVIGSRFLSAKLDFTPPHRKLAIKLVTRLFDIVGRNRFTDLQSGFRAYNTRALSATYPSRSGMGASTEIIKRAVGAGLKIREVPVPVYYNTEQPSLLNTIIQFLDVFYSTIGPVPAKSRR